LAVLKDAGFEYVHTARFPTPYTWTVDALIGFAYSTSVFARPVLGDRANAFERDLHQGLDKFEAYEELHQTIDFAYELGRRPGEVGGG
jgi:hypothetical protein